MRRLLSALLLLAACGDNAATDDDVAPDAASCEDIVCRLDALPDVRAEEWMPPDPFVTPGYRYVDLWFTEPVDHDDPSAGTFEVYAGLMHHDETEPLVVYTSGYDAGWTANLTEPAYLLQSNQISLEYRFFGSSKPAGGVPWPLLRVDQYAADEHDILTKLATIYTGNTIGTGGSKGGEHALEYAQLHPEDMDGVVAYVPPVITDLPDLRYDGITDRIGIASCTQALRAVAHRMLERRDAMDVRASAANTYDIPGVDHAVETGIVELEFSFWMTQGETHCNEVPDPATATDDQLWAFLDQASSPSGYDDEGLIRYGQQAYYQDQVELGYPIWNHAYLDDLMLYSYEDWSAYLPPGEPHVYAPDAPRALAPWVADTAEHVMTIDGEWDPWGAGYVTITPGRDAFQLWTPHGSHWSTGIYSLTPADQTTATDALRRWAGVAGTSPVVVPPSPMATRGPKVMR